MFSPADTINRLCRGGLLCLLALSGTAFAQLDDPMRPPEQKSTESKPAERRIHYTLSSVLIAPERRLAVINGRRVGLGEHIGGARVTSIQPTTVTLQRDTETITLRLVPLSVKRSRQ